MTSITQGAAIVGFSYDEVNRRSSLTLPNSVVVTYGYDDAAQLTSLLYKRGQTVLGDLSYEYDAAGRRVKMGGSYARTGLPQALASATHNDANQLTQRGASTLTYDDNGNLTSDGVNTYTWNARNQLQAMSGAVSASFQYDSFGRRTTKTVDNQTTSYLYDGANVVQERVGASSVHLLNGSLDEVLSRSDASGTWSPLRDGIGSTLALTDSSGTVQTQYSYEAFGQTSSTGAASSNTSGHTSQIMERYKHLDSSFANESVERIGGRISKQIATFSATKAKRASKNTKGSLERKPKVLSLLNQNGGADGTRTRDLRAA